MLTSITYQTSLKSVTGSSSTSLPKLFIELALASKGNIVSSPLSVHMILSLLFHGADSETLDELTTGLCHLDKNSIEEGYTSLIAVLNELKDVKLYIANALYVQDGLELLTEFLTIGTDVYQSVISKLDFKRNVDF